MAKLISVVYVGNKATAFDNIARSGKTWMGKGDVQDVTDVQAKLLLKYPDQWALANPSDAQAVNTPVSIEVTNEDGEDVAVDPEAFKKPLEHMTKAELKGFAHNRWGKNLDARQPTKSMIDQIEEWEKDADLVIGVK